MRRNTGNQIEKLPHWLCSGQPLLLVDVKKKMDVWETSCTAPNVISHKYTIKVEKYKRGKREIHARKKRNTCQEKEKYTQGKREIHARKKRNTCEEKEKYMPGKREIHARKKRNTPFQ